MLKQVFGDPQARSALLLLMNQCWDASALPFDWSFSELFVLFKGKGNDQEASNYRGINLLNDFYRIFERLIEVRLSFLAESLDLMGDCQFGFRSKRSTCDPCLILRTLAQYYADKFGVPFYVIFVDLEKAFPSLKRQALIDLLYSRGCPRKLIAALAACFRLNSCSLRIGSFLSCIIIINRGCREGGITSPGSFNIAYGDVIVSCDFTPLPSDLDRLSLSDVFILAFADDVSMMSADPSKLQTKFQLFSDQLSRYGMTVNANKTKVMCFAPKRFVHGPNPPFRLADSYLEFVDSFKYLGFLLRSDFDWCDHKKAVLSRGHTASIMIASLLNRLQISDLGKVRQFFQAFVVSQLFGRELIAFDEDYVFDLTSVFLKRCFCLPTGFPKIVCDVLLALPPFKWQQLRILKRFFARVTSGDNPAGNFFLFDRECCRFSDFPWFLEFCKILHPFVPVQESVLLSPEDVSDQLLDSVLLKIREQRILSLQNSSCSFLLSWFPAAAASQNFRRVLAEENFEFTRVVILFLGNMWRWSLFLSPRRLCFYCNNSLSSDHFFSCPSFPNPNSLVGFCFQDWLSKGRVGEWRFCFDVLRRLVRVWSDATGNLKPEIKSAVLG